MFDGFNKLVFLVGAGSVMTFVWIVDLIGTHFFLYEIKTIILRVYE